ncbi:hypothetical protein Ahy_B09g095805 isoform B [Arachis hypogaea]|uniref:Uncharacterized protein n=1 Tax=Arachis hypogaea TaxID=3818 RepID=A0A444XGI5_ARAHY|nr:hypothetical protein Ahy_B09g095805 isoform B [Arachis hypogaea]
MPLPSQVRGVRRCRGCRAQRWLQPSLTMHPWAPLPRPNPTRCRRDDRCFGVLKGGVGDAFWRRTWRTRFTTSLRPIADMSLTRDECHLGTYIFAKNEEMRETENLFKHYELTLPHGKFLSLRPECMPHFDVVKTVAMLSYLQAKANPVPRCWFFPSAFAAEILFQTLMEHVIESYARRWMPPTQELEHMAVLENIFKLEPNLPNFKHGSPDPNTWGRIEYPMSIPSRLGADESEIWCIWWMSHNG